MDKLRVAVLGLNFGRQLIDRSFAPEGQADSDFELVGVCDVDRAKSDAAAARYGVEAYYSMDALLAENRIPVVVDIAGPVGRAERIGEMIRAGKDVMTTKHFETAPGAAAAVLEEARSLWRVIHLNSPNPGASPDLAAMLSWRGQFDLGAPVAARAEVWTHYREEADGSWYDDPNQCPMAPVLRLGVYLINDLVRILGRARRVAVMGTRLFTGRPTDDNGQLSIEFENGALANVFASFCVRDGDHYRNGLTLNYERGTVYRNVGPERAGEETELGVVVNDDMWAPRRLAAQMTVPRCNGEYDWTGFAAAVRREADAPGYEIDHIVEPLRILDAMAKAAKSGKTEEV